MLVVAETAVGVVVGAGAEIVDAGPVAVVVQLLGVANRDGAGTVHRVLAEGFGGTTKG